MSRKGLFAGEKEDFLRELLIDHEPQEALEIFNQHYNVSLTYQQIYTFMHNRQLKVFRRWNVQSILTKEMDTFVREHYKGLRSRELTEMLNAEFGTSFTTEQIHAYKNNRRLYSGARGNRKGEKRGFYIISKHPTEAMKRTWFKKGRETHNHVPVGTLSKYKNGVWMRKIAEPCVWVTEARRIYEEAHGKLGDNMYVIHLDDNKDNLELENLFAVDGRAYKKMIGRRKLIKNDIIKGNAELMKTTLIADTLAIALKDAEQRMKNG